MCRKVKTVHNCANYLMRESFFATALIKWDLADFHIRMGKHQHEAYQEIPNAMSQQTVRRLGDSWDSYFKALKAYNDNPESLTGKPKIPGYAKGSKTAIMPFQAMKCVNNEIIFPKKTGLSPVKITCCKNQPMMAKGEDKVIMEVRFVPQGNCIWLEVAYKISDEKQKEKNSVLLDKKKHLGIDLGINNLATIVSDQPGFRPVLINGKTVKSVNHLYNKDAAALRSKGHAEMLRARGLKRSCWMNDHFHKVSRHVIGLCLKNDIGTIVIGYNKGWKDSINIGAVNNQKFVNIPHMKLVEQIQYKADEYGITVILREESYTSQASALDLDPVPTYDPKSKGVHIFTGKRVKRGLYRTSTGQLVNADVNGALNILRKEIGNGFVQALADEGAVLRPMRVDVKYKKPALEGKYPATVSRSGFSQNQAPTTALCA
jgi:putative transposase